MHLSGSARRVVAVAIALQAGFATTVLGAGGADARSGCEGVTGHLIDHGTTVTAVFHVPATCTEVSVLSWLAPDAHAGMPQTLFDRKGEHDVAPGDYRWTISAPPPECFRQLDLRIPGHNVDAIVGGERLCSPSSLPPPTSSPTTTSPSPTTTSPPSPKPAADAECTHWNVIAKSHEIIAGRYVQHFTLDATCVVKVVSFEATGPNWPHNGPQVPFDRWLGTRGPGSHTESVALPPCYFQADLVVNHRVIDTATGGTAACAPPAPSPGVIPPPPPPTTTTTTPPPTTAPPTTAPPTTAPQPPAPPITVAPANIPVAIAPSAVGPVRNAAPIGPATTSTTAGASVLGVVLTPPAGAAAALPNTGGGQQSGLASVALTGMAIGFGLITIGRQRRRSVEAQRIRR